jgi:chemotaxis protein histidine kinase CheA/CheY-like chemotaxis protein
MLTALSECRRLYAQAQTWDELIELVARMETSASEAPQPALRDVCALLKAGLQGLKTMHSEPGLLHRALLGYECRLMEAYLEGVDRTETISTLVTVLQHPAWVKPLSDGEARALRKRLSVADASAPAPARAGNAGTDRGQQPDQGADEPAAAGGSAEGPGEATRRSTEADTSSAANAEQAHGGDVDRPRTREKRAAGNAAIEGTATRRAKGDEPPLVGTGTTEPHHELPAPTDDPPEATGPAAYPEHGPHSRTVGRHPDKAGEASKDGSAGVTAGDPSRDVARPRPQDEGHMNASAGQPQAHRDTGAVIDAACAAQSVLGEDDAEPGLMEAKADPDPGGDTVWDGAGFSEAVREMIGLLVAELAEMDALVGECTDIAASPRASAEERGTALTQVREQFERFGNAAEVIGFEGLKRLCDHVCENLAGLEGSESALGPDLAELLRTWSRRAHAYVSDPDDTGPCAELARHACDPLWPRPVHDLDELVKTLASPRLSLEGEQSAPRATEAHAEDVSLNMPADVDAALLDGLLQELPAQTAEFTRSIHDITGGSLADVDVAQRVAHTLKGAANTVGVPGIANLTHHLEDILLALARHQGLPGAALADTLVSAADCLEMMSEALLGQGPGPENAVRTLQEVLDWANRIDDEGVEAAGSGGPPTPRAETSAPEGRTEPMATVPASGSAPPAGQPEDAVDTGSAAHAGTTPVLRVPAPLVDDLLRIVGGTIILTGQVQERVQRTIGQMRTMHAQFQLLQQLGHELEQLIDLRDVTLPTQRLANADFDPLELDQYNELHTCSRRLVEAATDAREMGWDIETHLTALEEMLVEQGRLNRESQEAVLHTRTVAVQTIVPRLQRSMRQASRVTGKNVVLECLGADTLVDGDILNELIDPLAHILRNSVDHGIEPEAERRAAGKEPTGRIEVAFQREGNHVVVRCADDGRGLDWPAIRRVALEQGLVGPDQEMDEDELARLVLRPNFTTRSHTTQLSGRGIGMDAAQARVSQLGGSLSLHSETGKGCTVELRLPLTLISTHALLVRSARHVFAVSARGVEQIVHGEQGQETQAGARQSFRYDDHVYPLSSLDALLGLEGEDDPGAARSESPVLLVGGEAGLQAVKVDAVTDSRDLVIKSLGRFVPRLRGIAGATILGDGSVAAVIDLPELLSTPVRAEPGPRSRAAGQTVTEVQVDLPVALVVDDSLSARRSLEQVLSDSGFRVQAARDGLEAIESIDKRRPDVVIVDLEMPRMNGLELTQHLRSREDTRKLPVLMVTSRSTEKHRKQAEAAGVTYYLTKPFSEDELLECVTAGIQTNA